MELLIINVVIILCVTAFAGILGMTEGEGLPYAWIAFVVSFNLSFIGWLIFIIHHFVVKYW